MSQEEKSTKNKKKTNKVTTKGSTKAASAKKKETEKTNKTKQVKQSKSANKKPSSNKTMTPEKKNTKKQETKINKKEEKNSFKKRLGELKENDSEVKRLIKIILIITVIMLIFYGVTLIATDAADDAIDDSTTEEEATTEIQYDSIMIGTLLNYSGTYYVLIEEDDDNRLVEYESLISLIESSDETIKFYTANLTDSFNKGYLGKEANYYPDNFSDFKVTGTTLIKVADNKIDSVYDNYDAIKNKLNDLK